MQLVIIILSPDEMDETPEKGTVLAGSTHQAFGRFSRSANYKDNGIRWLLMSVTDTWRRTLKD